MTLFTTNGMFGFFGYDSLIRFLGSSSVCCIGDVNHCFLALIIDIHFLYPSLRCENLVLEDENVTNCVIMKSLVTYKDLDHVQFQYCLMRFHTAYSQENLKYVKNSAGQSAT